MEFSPNSNKGAESDQIEFGVPGNRNKKQTKWPEWPREKISLIDKIKRAASRTLNPREY